MKRKIITAIAFNTIGAAVIVFGTTLPNRIAAIATSSIGCTVSALGFASIILIYEKELGASRQETLQWAKEAQTHLQSKQDLLLQFQELNKRVRSAEEEYAIASSFLEFDEEWIENMEKAELN